MQILPSFSALLAQYWGSVLGFESPLPPFDFWPKALFFARKQGYFVSTWKPQLSRIVWNNPAWALEFGKVLDKVFLPLSPLLSDRAIGNRNIIRSCRLFPFLHRPRKDRQCGDGLRFGLTVWVRISVHRQVDCRVPHQCLGGLGMNTGRGLHRAECVAECVKICIPVCCRRLEEVVFFPACVIA